MQTCRTDVRYLMRLPVWSLGAPFGVDQRTPPPSRLHFPYNREAAGPARLSAFHMAGWRCDAAFDT